MVGEFTPRQIKLAVVGEGTAEKDQVQYMVKQILGLDDVPHPDHAADALAAAICYVTHGPRQVRRSAGLLPWAARVLAALSARRRVVVNCGADALAAWCVGR